MKRSPQLRAAVLRGYLNLAFFIAIVAILLVPFVHHPDVRGIRIMLIAIGLIGITLAIVQRIVRSKWSWLLAGGCMTWSVAQLGIAYFLPPTNTLGETVLPLLAIAALALLFLGLPRILRREGPTRKNN
jgi:quinol-cytochrome oxidoreductase complex cytochrome b subunit